MLAAEIEILERAEQDELDELFSLLDDCDEEIADLLQDAMLEIISDQLEEEDENDNELIINNIGEGNVEKAKDQDTIIEIDHDVTETITLITDSENNNELQSVEERNGNGKTNKSVPCFDEIDLNDALQIELPPNQSRGDLVDDILHGENGESVLDGVLLEQSGESQVDDIAQVEQKLLDQNNNKHAINEFGYADCKKNVDTKKAKSKKTSKQKKKTTEPQWKIEHEASFSYYHGVVL